MASSTDRSEDALPRPELNPLLNPLLADNMGRWAEVYFTSPPERREEAVLDLLRELQARNSEQQTRVGESRQITPAEPEMAVPHVGRVAAGTRADSRRCENCGQGNPPRNQFCGMCGAKIPPPAAEGVAEQPRYPYEVKNSGILSPGYAESHEEYSEPLAEESASIPEGAAKNPYDLSLFQTLREKDVSPDYEYAESPSFRPRYYIGAVLALLIVALGYFAWRAARASQDAQTSPPPPAVATDSAPTPSSQNTAPSAPSTPVNSAHQQPAPPEKKPPEPTGTMPADAPARTQTAAAERSRVPNPPPSASSPSGELERPGPQGSGAEDFTVAQRYLNGKDGRGRNTAEAAKWLWGAIAKHNGPAMVALADLYLRGDGVSKNCDQARVLLDSAALRGVAGAGQRLRNLQAFGCQ